MQSPPQCTGNFCPPTVARESSFLVQCFLYPPDASAAVDAQARQADDTATRRGSYSLPLDVPAGARIDLHLEMPGLTVTEPDAFITWRGRITPVQFDVTVPADAPGASRAAPLKLSGSLSGQASWLAASSMFSSAMRAAGAPVCAVEASLKSSAPPCTASRSMASCQAAGGAAGAAAAAADEASDWPEALA